MKCPPGIPIHVFLPGTWQNYFEFNIKFQVEITVNYAKVKFGNDESIKRNVDTLEALATTGGGRELEKRYGLDFCLSMSVRDLGPAV